MMASTTVTLETVGRNAACAAVTALLNGGKLRVRASTTTLVDFTLAATAFDAPSVGVATARGGDGANPCSSGNPLSGTGAAAGVADNYQLLESGGTLVGSGDVTMTGTSPAGSLVLDNTNIASSQVIKVNTLTYTQPA